MSVVLVKFLDSTEKAGGDPDVRQNRPHVVVGDAGEGGREIEQEERAKGVVARSLVDRRIHFDDVGGYVAALEETALLGKAESGSEGGEDHIEN